VKIRVRAPHTRFQPCIARPRSGQTEMRALAWLGPLPWSLAPLTRYPEVECNAPPSSLNPAQERTAWALIVVLHGYAGFEPSWDICSGSAPVANSFTKGNGRAL
jgi:hypothetical protein